MITFWQLPPDLQQQVLRLPADLAGKLVSRIVARTLRRLFLWYGPDFSILLRKSSKTKKERKIKRLHVLFKFIYHRKLYTPINRVFSSWLLWFSFSKILLSKNVCCCIYGILLRVFCPTVRWKRLEFSNCMMHENLQEHSQSRKDLVWTVIRFTLDSWLIFLDCNMFYLEY